MAQTVLQTHGLTKEYGAFTALNAVSLTLKQGDIYVLVGRNSMARGKQAFQWRKSYDHT